MWEGIRSTWRWLLMIFGGFMIAPLPVIRQDDHLILRYYAAVTRVIQPVMCHILKSLTGTSSNFKTHLPNLRGFYQQEKDKLEANVPCEEYDITLIYKLLQRIGGLANDQYSNTGTLENNLQMLKEHRNDLAHEELDLSGGEFNRRIDSIRNLGRNALTQVGQKINVNMQSWIQQLDTGLDEVLAGDIDLWESYCEGLRQLRQELHNVIVREGKKEILSKSYGLRILNPFVWLTDASFKYLDVNQIFTNIQLQSQRLIDVKDLLITQDAGGNIPTALVIHGKPGIGKTSLIRFILHDYLAQTPSINNINEYELVIPLELRHVTCSSIQEMLRQQLFPLTSQHFRDEDIIPTLQKVSILWLVDGYDEASSNTQLMLRELLVKFSCSKFIITTRTEYQSEIEFLLNNHQIDFLMMKIQGFSVENITEHLTRLFSVYPHNVDNNQNFIDLMEFIDEKKSNLWELFCVPLYLVIVFIIWMENPTQVKEIKTSTGLFQALVNHILVTMSKRTEFSCLRLTEGQVKRKCCKLLHSIGKISWINFTTYNYNLSERQLEELENTCTNLGLPFQECMSPFYHVRVQASINGITEVYEPLHRTVHEFISAEAFINDMVQQNIDVLSLGAQYNNQVKEKHKDKHVNSFAKSVYLRDKFAIEKLCDSQSKKFEDFEFIERSTFINNISCCESDAIYPCNEEEDLEEFERCYVNVYFGNLFFGSLIPVFMIGLLKCKNELQKVLVEQIIYICTCMQGFHRNYKVWLNFIKETHEDTTVIEELKSQVCPFIWSSTPSSLPIISELLQYIIPKGVHIHSCTKHEMIDDKRSISKGFIDSDTVCAVKKISKYPVDVILDFRTLMLGDQSSYLAFNEMCKSCIKAVVSNEALCHLTGLLCRLDGEILTFLEKAYWLEELDVEVNNSDDLISLSDILPKLKYLNNVAVVIMVSLFTLKCIPIQSIPTLNTYKKQYYRKKYSLIQYFSHSSFPGLSFNRDLKELEPLPGSRPSYLSVKVNVKKFNKKCSKSTTVSIIPFPSHYTTWQLLLQFLNLDEFEIPSVHCHPLCDKDNPVPEVCNNMCGHSYGIRLPNDQVKPLQRSKEIWDHHQAAISYHKNCIKRLRSAYNLISKFPATLPDQEKYSKTFDPILKIVRYIPLQGNVYFYMNNPLMKMLIACELALHQHCVSKQQHLKFLSSSYLTKNQKCTPLTLFIRDPFCIPPNDFAMSVKKLCPNPRRLLMRGYIANDTKADELAQYVWELGAQVPGLQELGIEVVAEIDDQPMLCRIHAMLDSVILLVERSAPLFDFSIHLAPILKYIK